jgi:hypothetical protein
MLAIWVISIIILKYERFLEDPSSFSRFLCLPSDYNILPSGRVALLIRKRGRFHQKNQGKVGSSW